MLVACSVHVYVLVCCVRLLCSPARVCACLLVCVARVCAYFVCFVLLSARSFAQAVCLTVCLFVFRFPHNSVTLFCDLFWDGLFCFARLPLQCLRRCHVRGCWLVGWLVGARACYIAYRIVELALSTAHRHKQAQKRAHN